MDKEQEVGITETSDPSFNLELFENLRSVNIIVTKRLTDSLIDKLIEHKNKCILHLTCTGMGGSKLEPLVPNLEETIIKFDKLLSLGFPVTQVVLRVDPIIPTSKGVKTALKVIKKFINQYDIKRIRWSSLDMYNHVKERFTKNGLPIPYDNFHANIVQRNGLYSILEGICYVNDISLEACGEEGYNTPCISQKDLDILGNQDIILIGNAEQRKHCSCPSNKVQLIKDKPSQCKNGCLYCFWQDNK